MKQSAIKPGSSLIYWLFITFIYMNIVMPGTYSFVIASKKVLFVLMLAVFLFAGARFPRSIVTYIMLSIGFVMTLAIYSLAMGNELSNISIFVTPLLFLLSAPMLYSIREEFNLDSYLKHILIAVMIVSTLTLLIATLAIGYLNEIAVLLQIMDSNYGLMYMSGMGMRISVQTAPFMPVGAFIAYYYYRKKHEIKYLIFSSVICLAVYFTKTIGIWAALIFGFIMLMIWYQEGIVKKMIPFLVIVATVFLVMQVVIPDMRTNEAKDRSYTIKEQQVENGLSMFSESVWLGVGLGSPLNLDDRNIEQPIIEILPLLILIGGGVIGFTMYLYIYFSTVIKFFLVKLKPDILYVLIVSHLSIVLSGFSNPYFMSGGTGLFFIVLLLAFQGKKIKLTKLSEQQLIVVGKQIKGQN